MKVSELIEMLSEMDPDAQVFIASQQNWPFEYSVYGVARRAEMNGDDADDEEIAATYEPGTAPGDVFLCEGTQLRYGSKTAWEVARRR